MPASSAQQRHRTAQIAAKTRWARDPQSEDEVIGMRLSVLSERVRDQIAAMPPLTDAQRQRLLGLLFASVTTTNSNDEAAS